MHAIIMCAHAFLRFAECYRRSLCKKHVSYFAPALAPTVLSGCFRNLSETKRKMRITLTVLGIDSSAKFLRFGLRHIFPESFEVAVMGSDLRHFSWKQENGNPGLEPCSSTRTTKDTFIKVLSECHVGHRGIHSVWGLSVELHGK